MISFVHLLPSANQFDKKLIGRTDLLRVLDRLIVLRSLAGGGIIVVATEQHI